MDCVQLKEGKKEILLLVPELAIDRIRDSYINPLKNVPEEAFIILRLFENENPSVVLRKQFIKENVVPLVEEYDLKYLLVTEGSYFKTLTRVSKVDIYLGYELPCVFCKAKVLYIPNFFRIFYNPDIVEKINMVLKKLDSSYEGKYEEPGKNIISFANYPSNVPDISDQLENLKQHDKLTVDIETYSLKHNAAGITSIAFAWNEHEGCAFRVDPSKTKKNQKVRELLKSFFETYQGTLIFHNIAFDAYILIYTLWMQNQNDEEGLLEGLNIMLRNWDDTKLISYLALNSCTRISYRLKDLAQEFAGNYAQDDIEDASGIPDERLLPYNLTDTLATWFVYHKYYSKMVEDKQLDIYENIFKPATKDIIQMQLTGLPINLQRVAEVKANLEKDKEEALQKIYSLPLVQKYTRFLNEALVNKKNSEYKVKRITIDDVNEKFNPASNRQIADLLFVFCGLSPLKHTQSGQPATDSESLSELLDIVDDPEIKTLLEGLLEYAGVEKLLSAFIPAFEKAIPGNDGWHYLCGNFNLGGTVSGRLSSNNPNLQNLPATGTKYAKLIKSCFQAPKGKILIGLDFASLEDRISALTTKDCNKLKVYTDHYDGHCLRAFSYFGNKMPDIQKEYAEAKDELTRVKVINSIKNRYKALRQASKGPTFALTYAGTWRTLMSKFKMSPEEAKAVEKRYHELYKESDNWVKDKLKQASKDGYITAAFGLRVRTPLMAQSVRGNKATPNEVNAEGRTAGNALGQSWCLLNSRAASDFLTQVRKHPKYRTKIRPCAQIHDAQYYLIDDDIDMLLWINKVLVKAVQWQDHPDIYHSQVKLGGNLSIFYPDWAHEIELPNDCSQEKLLTLVKESR